MSKKYSLRSYQVVSLQSSFQFALALQGIEENIHNPLMEKNIFDAIKGLSSEKEILDNIMCKTTKIYFVLLSNSVQYKTKGFMIQTESWNRYRVGVR